MKESKGLKFEHIVIAILTVVIAVLILMSISFGRRNYVIAREFILMQDLIYGLFAQEPLEAEIQEDPTDDIRYYVIQRILDEAPEKLRQVFDEDMELNTLEDFVMLPRNRILISGQWFCSHTQMPHTIEAIFGFRLWNDVLWLDLLSYSPFGWNDWRDPWGSPNRHSWARHHELETVPVRFYEVCSNFEEIWYVVEYLDGEMFSDKLAYYTLKHLNRRITDAWFSSRGRILYVNLHHSEPMAMSSGTTGEFMMYLSLVLSMASVPDIDALVILVDGRREAEIGGHGMSFRDIYLTNDLSFASLRGW